MGIAAGVIAFNQYRLSRDKLKLDLFDKRFAVLNSVFESCMAVYQDKDNEATIFTEEKVRRQAFFLFNREVVERIASILARLMKFQDNRNELRKLIDGQGKNETIDGLELKTNSLHERILREMEDLTVLAEPYLRIHHQSRVKIK